MKALGLDDVCVEFEITPNRPDCLSVRGLGRGGRRYLRRALLKTTSRRSKRAATAM